MAHQINPLTPLVTEEFKEVNKEDYKVYFDKSQEEVSRLSAENRELILKLEKLNKKLNKRKGELETERTNSNTFRQFIQELNTKVQQLEGAAPPPLLSPTIPPLQNPILSTVINEEFIERLVIEKTGLESQVYEQKLEIEHLNSELMSCKKGLTQQTESRHQEYALNREVTQLRTNLALKEQQLEAELGKHLQQHLDQERGVKEKLCLEIQQLNNQIATQRTYLTEQFAGKEDTLRANEGILLMQIDELQIEKKRWKDDENTQNAQTELNELKGTFAIMSKEGNKLIEENENMKAKQVENDMEIQGLLKSITEYKIRDEKLTNELSELKHSNSVVKEGQFDSLMTENSKLQDTNKQLSEDLSKLEIERKARIEELMETKSKQQQTIDNNNKHLSELQEKDKSINKLAKEMETMRTDLGKDFTKACEHTETSTCLNQFDLLQPHDPSKQLEPIANPTKQATSVAPQPPLQSSAKLLDEDPFFSLYRPKRSQFPPKGPRSKSFRNSILETWDQVELHPVYHPDPLEQGVYKGRVPKPRQEVIGTKVPRPISPCVAPANLAPRIVPVDNKSGKPPLGISYRNKMVNTIKLISQPNPSEHQGKQVICQINKWYQLGDLMGIFEIRTTMNFESVIQKYAGIKLYNPVGNSNGQFHGTRYFECDPNCGIFVPFEDVLIPVV